MLYQARRSRLQAPFPAFGILKHRIAFPLCTFRKAQIFSVHQIELQFSARTFNRVSDGIRDVSPLHHNIIQTRLCNRGMHRNPRTFWPGRATHIYTENTFGRKPILSSFHHPRTKFIVLSSTKTRNTNTTWLSPRLLHSFFSRTRARKRWDGSHGKSTESLY
jgi:hypothetical protein